MSNHLENLNEQINDLDSRLAIIAKQFTYAKRNIQAFNGKETLHFIRDKDLGLLCNPSMTVEQINRANQTLAHLSGLWEVSDEDGDKLLIALFPLVMRKYNLQDEDCSWDELFQEMNTSRAYLERNIKIIHACQKFCDEVESIKL